MYSGHSHNLVIPCCTGRIAGEHRSLEAIAATGEAGQELVNLLRSMPSLQREDLHRERFVATEVTVYNILYGIAMARHKQRTALANYQNKQLHAVQDGIDVDEAEDEAAPDVDPDSLHPDEYSNQSAKTNADGDS